MSYVMPPNNNIKAIADQNRSIDDQRNLYMLGVRYDLADFTNTPDHGGPVRGLEFGCQGGRR